MATYSSDQLRAIPWIVSSGTLRTEDLLPALWQTAETLWPVTHNGETFGAARPALASELERLVGEDSSHDAWTHDAANQVSEQLFDILSELAPNGFYFGSHEGDGALFGFWLAEDWAEALEDRSLLSEDPEISAALIAELVAHGIDAEDLADAYQGAADSPEAWCAEFCEDCGLIDPDAKWPLNYIDWAGAWRDLRLGDGYFSIDDPGCKPTHCLIFRPV